MAYNGGKMKKSLALLCVLFFFSISLNAQVYKGDQQMLFLLNQPNARAEAMGKGNAALFGSPFMSFYNPAASSFSEDVTVEVSHLEFNVPWDYTPVLSFPLHGTKSNYDTYGAGLNFGKYGAVSLHYLHYYFRTKFYNYSGILFTPSANILMLNYSYPVLKGLSAGINVRYQQDSIAGTSSKGWMADFGLLKHLSIESATIRQNIYFGLSFSNIFNAKMTNKDRLNMDYYLPSIMRLAGAYELQPQNAYSGWKLFKGLFTAEYFDLMNSKFWTQFHFGAEITLMEMIKLRGGWFTQKIQTLNFNDKPEIDEFTYGFGLNLPVRRFSGLPLNINFDHTSLPFPNYGQIQYVGKDCPVYTLNVSYGI